MSHFSNLEAEQAVLGAILFDRNCAEMVAELSPEDFCCAEHCEIFAAIQREVSDGRKPTPLAVVSALGAMTIGKLPVAEYVTRLGTLTDRSLARENLALVRALASRRALMWISEAIAEEAKNSAASPKDTALGAIKALNEAIRTTRGSNSRPQTVHAAVTDLVDSLDDPEDGSLISTGLSSLDKFMGGWPRGELSIIAGRPSMGKSALLSAIARRGAKRGVNTLVFSLEMPKSALAARMLSDFVYGVKEDQRIPYSAIIQRQLTAQQKARLRSAAEAFENYSILIDDTRGLTIPEIQMRALRRAEELAKQGKRLDVVMIDHIGKIKAGERYRGSMNLETGEKSDALMNMAFDLEVAVVAAHQLNRNTEGREDKHPTPADLRDSGNLEQDAHTLVFPYRPAYYLERNKCDDPEKDRIRQAVVEKKKNVMEIIVAKCRNGACGTVEAFVDMASNHVRDLHYERET